MHELALAQEILNLALKESEGKKIISITISLAENGHITAQSLREAFYLVSQGTLAESAKLKIKKTNDLEIQVKELEVEN
ncbi:MAG: hydrogenase/urease maturation nickel metallochaperone HypA [Candidatus Omnitrophica bacterium]|nr:hydrogenase/urease maturation nickel metallochaperone HypA [Candidatus Omnitrophota bacterium]